MELMQAKVEKNLRNTINRQVNARLRTSSRRRTLPRGRSPRSRAFSKGGGEDAFPESLRETVRLRLRYPTDSLTELARRFDPPISKPGLSHRLKKITEFAAKEN